MSTNRYIIEKSQENRMTKAIKHWVLLVCHKGKEHLQLLCATCLCMDTLRNSPKPTVLIYFINNIICMLL